MPDQDPSVSLPGQPATPSDSPATTPSDDASPAVPGNLPLRTPTPTSQPLTPEQAPKQAPADSTTAHHSILGKVAERLFSGGNVEYSVDPTSGKTVSTVTKERPGDLFRHILAGAIMGSAAGAGSTDFFGGFAKGGAAVIERQQQEDQQRRANAEQQFQNQQSVRKLDEADEKISNERVKFDAQTHHWNVAELRAEAFANHKGLDLLQKENALSLRKLEADTKAGGIAAPIKGNDQPGAGKDLQALYTKDPSQFAAPTGYVTSISKEYDLGDLNYDFSKNGWEDEKGNSADLADHTTWHIRYVPQSAANAPQSYTGRELSQFFPDIYGGGKLDPEKNYTLTNKDFTAVAERQATLHHQDFEDNFKRVHEDVANVVQEGKNRLASLHAEYAAAARGPVPDDEKMAELQGQIDQLNDEIEQKISSADPHMRKVARDFYAAPTPTPVGTAPANPQTQPAAVTPGRTAPAPSAPGKPLVKPPKKGAPLTPALVDKYIAANGGDKAKARAAALNDGWTIPQAK